MSTQAWHALDAPEVAALLDLCTRRESAADPAPMTDVERRRIRVDNDTLAADGLRVLAVAWRPEGWPEDGLPVDLIFLGLVGLADPIRPRMPWWRLPVNALSWIFLVVLALLQWAAVGYLPMNRLLGTEPLALGDWAVVSVAILWPAALVEAAKAWGWLVPLGHARPKRNGPELGGRGESLRNP